MGIFDPVFKSLAMLVLIWALFKITRRIRQGRSEKEGGEVEALPLRVGVGFGGMASAVLAIGAGAVYIPVLNQFGGLESRRAIGTSLGLMMVVVPIAVLVHALLNSDPWPQVDVLAFLVIGVIGVNPRCSNWTPNQDQIILRIFVILLMIILLRYTWDLTNLVFFNQITVPRMSGPATHAPIEEPIFPITVTSRTRPARFVKSNLKLSSNRNSCKSLFRGALNFS